jgi:hypothetical protein
MTTTSAIAQLQHRDPLKPDYTEAYTTGLCLLSEGGRGARDRRLHRAIALRPNYPKAYNMSRRCLHVHGYGGAKAVADFDRAIALKPDFRYAYINRANARLLRHPWLALGRLSSGWHVSGKAGRSARRRDPRGRTPVSLWFRRVRVRRGRVL